MQPDATVQAIISLAGQLGTAVVFILAWLAERKERQALVERSMTDNSAREKMLYDLLANSIQKVQASSAIEARGTPKDTEIV